jgi:hypothetical protein
VFPRLVNVQHIEAYILELTFADGVKGQLDFTHRIMGRGGVFRPLEKLDYFKQVTIDPEAKTLIWPNGVDLDPDVLYSQVTGQPLPVLEPTS